MVEKTTTLQEKINLIQKEYPLIEEVPMVFLHPLYEFLTSEPQHYYNRNATKEVQDNLKLLFNKDKDLFIKAFDEQQLHFFHSLNSYNHIINLHGEFDDVNFDNETKIKIYYLPIITQLMEFCLSHIYKTILYIIHDYEKASYKDQKTLGQLKDSLVKFGYTHLTDIDIDLRNSISHGNIAIMDGAITYQAKKKKTRNYIEKKCTIYQLEDIKNKLLDLTTGALVGIITFLIQEDCVNHLLSNTREDVQTTYLKLTLRTKNVKVKMFSKGKIGPTQLNTDLEIQNIDDKDEILYLLIVVSEIIFCIFDNYERYHISYNHPFSTRGFVTFKHSHLKALLENWTPLTLNTLIANAEIMITDIQHSGTDIRSHKFHMLPTIKGTQWIAQALRDNSVENIKRFIARLIIDDKTMSKQQIITLIEEVTNKIKVLENIRNPVAQTKYGTMDADAVRLEVFFKTNTRNFTLLKNNPAFICIAQYYKNDNVHKIQVEFLAQYAHETNQNFDIYWNQNFKASH